MSRSTSLSLVLALTGCSAGLDLTHTGPHADLYDDGTALRVTGCDDGMLFGCNPPGPGVTMTAITDGLVHDIQPSTDDQPVDQILGVFADGPFQRTLPSPLDREVALELDGYAAAVTLPPAFAITPPPAQVSRADGALTIAHEVLDGSLDQGVVVSTCQTRRSVTVVDEEVAGTLVLSFDLFTSDDGACTHEIHVDQTTTSDRLALPVRLVRIGVVRVTSEP